MDLAARKKFRNEAPPVPVTLGDGTVLRLIPKIFKTGSVGWHTSQKCEVEGMMSQVNIVVTVLGSKPDPDQVVNDAVEEFTSPIYAPDAPPRLPVGKNGTGPVKQPRKRS